MKNAYGAPSSKLSASSDPFSIILYSIIAFASAIRPFIREIIPYRIPANIIMTCLTFLLMAPFLKALIGWNIITTKFIKDKLGWLFPHKQAEEIELAVKCAKKNMTTRNTPKIRPPAEFAQHWTTEPYVCATFSPAPARFQKFITNYGWPKGQPAATDSFDQFPYFGIIILYCNRRS